VRVSPRLARVLGAALTHLVRNAVAHGIEPPQFRKDAGKPETGTIHVVATESIEGPRIVIEDDGRGLDIAAIKERAAQLGVSLASGSRRSPSDLVFVAGLSTVQHASALAGRGVGLGAVRDDLERVGYSVQVESEPGRFTRFVLEPKGAT
jgi:two-component system chemotaxis sensor kinase CheA